MIRVCGVVVGSNDWCVGVGVQAMTQRKKRRKMGLIIHLVDLSGVILKTSK